MTKRENSFTFYADDDVKALLARVSSGKRSRTINEAIRRHVSDIEPESTVGQALDTFVAWLEQESDCVLTVKTFSELFRKFESTRT